MSFVPGYENDLFISYAHNDNSTHNSKPEDAKRNWVSLLEDYIRTRARGRGHELKIYRDVQLNPFTGVNQQLADRIAQSAIFICVVSPNYAKSKWCLWELEQAFKLERSDSMLRIGKYPLDDSELQPGQKELLQKTDHLLEARFYTLDESKKSIDDLQPELFPEHLTEFYKRLNPIVDKIISRLKELRSASTSQPRTGHSVEVTNESRIAVYLAETSKDLAETKREQIRSELAQSGCRVLPDQPLPRDSGQLRDAIRKYLEQAKLSIHLIGETYGEVLDGEDCSIPHLQFDLATERREQEKLTQIVWLPPELAPKGKLQENFIAELKANSPDYLQSKLKELKAVIWQKLKPEAPNGWEETREGQVKVCFYYHELDKEPIKPIYSHLRIQKAFNVKRPLQDAASFNNHQQLLQSSDAVLLYYGNGDDEWFGNLWLQIQRHTSAGKAKPILVRAIYAGQPMTEEKDLLDSKDPLIIKNFDDFKEETLAQFIERIELAKGGKR